MSHQLSACILLLHSPSLTCTYAHSQTVLHWVADSWTGIGLISYWLFPILCPLCFFHSHKGYYCRTQTTLTQPCTDVTDGSVREAQLPIFALFPTQLQLLPANHFHSQRQQHISPSGVCSAEATEHDSVFNPGFFHGEFRLCAKGTMFGLWVVSWG